MEESYTAKAIEQVLQQPKSDIDDSDADIHTDVEYDDPEEPPVTMLLFYPEAKEDSIQSIVEAGWKKMNDEFSKKMKEVFEKPWTLPGALPQDYFNFGFDEETWKCYINRQILMRFERNLIDQLLSQKEKIQRQWLSYPYYCKMYSPKSQKSSHVPVSYTHLRAHETSLHLVCRLLLEKKKKKLSKVTHTR
eukprot:TRINITY_DN66342_c0_g1_i1.p1 TRINITY_DN66342_c0_g1~~TRINITY_DN66342_c0_g1_i1.p1  ORF type:complete len:191 (+),score=46.72 TRINITY_DN66342_c0_g1_i1:71-643(+)